MRIKICIEYNGTEYVGWQKQKNGRSIQEEIEKSLKLIFKKNIAVFGAGRTDSGVHAINQVAHFDVDYNYDLEKLQASMNFFLKESYNSISIVKLKKVSKKFHARFSARKKIYVYKILNRKIISPFLNGQSWFIPYHLNLKTMKIASTKFLGEKDFSSFRSKDCQSLKSIRTLNNITLKKLKDEIIIKFHAKSFLHNQVRIIVGSLVNVVRGFWKPEKINEIFEKKNRSFAGPTAPAKGLYLEKILY